ncbi:MAG TPA: carbohydrate-binding protein, partial [Polyangia bacterium]|nr:carbohydrate-binding protein [Polyangia bacterium]
MSRTVAIALGLVSAFGLLLGTSTPASAKDLIEYFKPTPIVGTLSSTAWGAAATGPRDTQNGLEDATLKSYVYWDGQIMRGPDGKYHMYASRWAQTAGHSGWGKSIAVHAVSDTMIGPYVDKGAAYTDQAGKGHNVTGSMLPDGTWTVIVSDTRPGDIFTSSSIDGPWTLKG